MMRSGAFTGFIKGTWEKNDPSYARPLELETKVERW